MRIKRIKIDRFGGLEDFTLNFADGFNLVFGNNEDGKSTVMAFLRLAFYGSGTQKSDLSANLRRRFTPFSGDKMGGEVEFSYKGRDYLLSKQFGKTPRSDKAVLLDLYSGKTLKTEGEIGEWLFGMSAAAFERSIFIGSFTPAEDGSGELSAKLASLLYSGDENESLGETKTRLSDAILELHTSRKKGSADRLAEKADTLTTEKHSAAEREQQRLEKLKKLKANEALLASLNDKKRENDRLLSKSRDSENLAAYSSELRLRAQLKELTEQSGEGVSASLEATQNRVAEIKRQIDEKTSAIEKPASCVFPFLAAASFTLAAAAGFFASPVFLSLLLPAVINLVLGFVFMHRRKNERATVLQQLAELSRSLAAAENEQFSHSENGIKIDALREVLSGSPYRDMTEEELHKRVTAPQSEHSAAVYAAAIRDIDLSLNRAHAENARLLAESEALLREGRTIGVIENEILSAKRELAAMEEHYSALTLAAQVLDEAYDEMRSGFAPELERLTSEMLTKITGGKHERATISDELAITVSERGTVPYSADYLSSGSADQAELSLRLAIAALTSGERDLPLLLDDVLMQYDDGRAKIATAFLAEYARENQVLLFTCHGFFKELAEARGANIVLMK